MNWASAGPASGGALTKLAALADCKAGEGAAQQRQYRREAIAGQRAGLAIADRPERSVVDEQQAAAAQQPLDPGGGVLSATWPGWAASSMSRPRPCLQGSLRLGHEQRKAISLRSTWVR